MATGPSGLDPRADWSRIVDGGSGRVPDSQIAVAVLRARLRSVERRYLTVRDLRPTMRSLTAYSMGKLLLAASHLENLHRAWRDVRVTATKSSWPQISADLAALDTAPIRALQVIKRQLRAGSYEFSAKQGYTKRKSGGSRRGITVQSVRDRIVQRSILNVIYTNDGALKKLLGEIPATLEVPTSFAGAPGRGVPEAIAFVMTSIGAVRVLLHCRT